MNLTMPVFDGHREAAAAAPEEEGCGVTEQQTTESLISTAAELIGVVRDYGAEDVGKVLDPLSPGHWYRLSVVLAAMVDPDATIPELLGWLGDGPVESRQFTPPAYDMKNVNADAMGRRAERRAEIIRLTNEGLTRPQIAARMGVTVRCVERHRAAIRQALEMAS